MWSTIRELLGGHTEMRIDRIDKQDENIMTAMMGLLYCLTTTPKGFDKFLKDEIRVDKKKGEKVKSLIR